MTDFSSILLKVQDPKTGEYHPLPNDRQSRIVVNVGDFASIMSGGKLHSPVHRVDSPCVACLLSTALGDVPEGSSGENISGAFLLSLL